MKRLYRVTSLLLVALILIGACPVRAAAATNEFDPVEIVRVLGLIKGTGDGVDTAYLASEPIRLYCAILFVRLAGLEEEAYAYEGKNGFTDMEGLSQNNRNLLAYLKDHPKLGFDGFPDGSFRPYEVMTAQQFTKVMLTALGYEVTLKSNPDGDFTWDEVFTFAASLGLTEAKEAASFRVSDMITILAQALALPEKGKVEATLADRLAAEGIIDADLADAYGLLFSEEGESGEAPPMGSLETPPPAPPAPSVEPPAPDEDPGLENAIYVNGATGDDQNDGSWDAPYKTIQRAANAAAAGDTVYIRGGIYRETVTPKNSGTADNPIRYVAYNGEDVVITALDLVNPAWTLYKTTDAGHNIYKTTETLALGSENAIFTGLEMMMPARWPNAVENAGDQPDFMKRSTAFVDNKDEKTTKTALYDDDMPDKNWTGGKVWVYTNWISWTSGIKAYAGQTLTIDNNAPDMWTELNYFEIRSDRLHYYIYDHIEALDIPGEWYYDPSGTLYLCAPDNELPSDVNKKVRTHALVLDGADYIELSGIRVIGAGIKGDNMNHITFDNMKLQDYGFDTDCTDKYGSQLDIGIILSGDYITFQNSEIFNCSGYGISIKGNNATIFNNYIHDIGYAGAFTEAFSINGADAYVGYNTITRTGAGGVGGNMTHRALIEHNDFSFCGMLSYDNGTMHWAKNDYQNTEIRYNLFHDGQDGAGYIYLDNGCSNMSIHDNYVYNVMPRENSVSINQPGNHVKIYNNLIEGNFDSQWGYAFKDDTYQIEVYDNKISGELLVTGTAKLYDNEVGKNNADFKTALRAEINAGLQTFVAGHDFVNPPNPTREFDYHPRRNLVRNGGFEGHIDHYSIPSDLNSWDVNGANIKGQNAIGESISQETGVTRTGDNSVRMGPGTGSIQQVIAGIQPNMWYEFNVWVKSVDDAAAVTGVKDSSGKIIVSAEVSSTGINWSQQTILFQAGESDSSFIVFLEKTTDTSAPVYGDDFGLVCMGAEKPEPPNPEPGMNVLRDAGFEEQNEFWTMSGGAGLSGADAFRGEYELAVPNGGSAAQTVRYEVFPGHKYILSAVGKLSGTPGSGTGTISLVFKDNADGIIGTTAAELTFETEVYTSRSIAFTMPVGTAAVEVVIANDSGMTFYLDQVSLHERINLIHNPGYEESERLVGYLAAMRTVVRQDGVHAHRGDSYMVMEPVSNDYAYVHAYVMLGLKENTTYTMSIWGKRGAGATDGSFVQMEFQTYKDDAAVIKGVNSTLVFTSTDYTQETITFTTPPGTTVGKLVFWAPKGNAAMYIDDLELYEEVGDLANPPSPPDPGTTEPTDPVELPEGNLIPGADCDDAEKWSWFGGIAGSVVSDGHTGQAMLIESGGAYLDLAPSKFGIGETYRFSAWGKRLATNGDVYVVIFATVYNEEVLYQLSNWTNTGDYERHSLTFTVPQGTTNIRCQIYVGEAGALYIDDVELIRLTGEEEEEPVTGNLIPGGSCDESIAWSFWNTADHQLVPDGGHDGGGAYLLTGTNDGWYYHVTEGFGIGNKYKFSAWGKRAGTNGAVYVSMIARRSDNSEIAAFSFDPFTVDYEFRELEFVVPEGTAHLRFQVYFADNSDGLYIDDVTLVLAEDTEEPGGDDEGIVPGNLFPAAVGSCSDLDQWTLNSLTAELVDGRTGKAIHVSKNGGDDAMFYEITSGLEIGGYYEISLWGMVGSGTTWISLKTLNDYNQSMGDDIVLTPFSDTGNYAQESAKFWVPAGTTKLRLVVYVTGNDGLYLDDITLLPAEEPENLIPGGNFESADLTGWSSESMTLSNDTHNGDNALCIQPQYANYVLNDVTPGSYRFSAWVKRGEGNTGGLYFQIQRKYGGVEAADPVVFDVTSQEYVEVSCVIEVTADMNQIVIFVWMGSDIAPLYLDDIKLVKLP